jgi:hypothetical protein
MSHHMYIIFKLFLSIRHDLYTLIERAMYGVYNIMQHSITCISVKNTVPEFLFLFLFNTIMLIFTRAFFANTDLL